MRPPFSMILFTTLAGAGQGLLLVLFGVGLAQRVGVLSAVPVPLFVGGALLVLLLCGAGLVSATFHLGRPMRAWRAASQWRTSWLSREVIALPVFMALAAAWGLSHAIGQTWLPLELAAALLALVLYLCTGMIYAAIKVMREWATPLTPLNFAVLGLASGAALATALAAATAPVLTAALAQVTIATTLFGALTRAAHLWRNATLGTATTLQTAIGIRHPRIVPASPPALGGAFNRHEFWHGRSDAFVRGVRWAAISFGFVVPVVALAIAHASLPATALAVLGLVQLVGLVAERWIFFADARHPQRVYTG
jgi:sulfite dehydrogenase (quinone) subunit SoeC